MGAALREGRCNAPACDALVPDGAWRIVGAGRKGSAWIQAPFGIAHEPHRMGSTGWPSRNHTAVPLVTYS